MFVRKIYLFLFFVLFYHLNVFFQLDVLFGNLPEMVEFQVEFLKTLEDGTRLVPDLEKLERVEQFKVWFMFLLKEHNNNYKKRNLTFFLPF